MSIDKFNADRAKTCCTDFIKLIFMDVNMPVVDGLMATRVIKAKAESDNKPLRIIGVTSFESDDAIQRCIDAGMSAVISKPIDVTRLSAAFDAHYAR